MNVRIFKCSVRVSITSSKISLKQTCQVSSLQLLPCPDNTYADTHIHTHQRTHTNTPALNCSRCSLQITRISCGQADGGKQCGEVEGGWWRPIGSEVMGGVNSEWRKQVSQRFDIWREGRKQCKRNSCTNRQKQHVRYIDWERSDGGELRDGVKLNLVQSEV